ncbi:protein of unknown function [Nitrosomonas nitrosa]|uniref:DUF4325 domain-containing protein n=1 Tax=Nitrosomonas nitrosa TaxID=52442 RepID=A0A1I4MVH5_9PROT|nr:STAS-like domain-containing protein [Nitrosomonas nitrosa]SFM07040.1 protein of unknown function [Nitrosomonas nitrosa]
MKSGLILSVIEITGNSACITAENGQRVYQRIVAAMNKNQIIELSFNNIRYMTPAFLNAAIGQLYSVFDQEVICSRLKIKDIERSGSS